MADRKRVLVVEDELLIAKVLRMQIEKLGHDVNTASEANEAVEVTSNWHPDIIIMDVYLKNSSCGIEAARKIRTNGNNVPIIFTTGNSLDSTAEGVKDIQQCKLFSKPVDFEQIAELIK